MRQIARFALLLILFTSAVTTPLAQSLYKSVGPNGVVSYSDQPPAENKNVKAMSFDDLPATVFPISNLPTTPPTFIERILSLWASWTTSKTTTNGVVLYTSSSCGYCKQAKTYLEGKNIKYKEIDVATKDGQASYVKAGGGKGVPLIVVAGKNVSGFSTAAYDALFAK